MNNRQFFKNAEISASANFMNAEGSSIEKNYSPKSDQTKTWSPNSKGLFNVANATNYILQKNQIITGILTNKILVDSYVVPNKSYSLILLTGKYSGKNIYVPVVSVVELTKNKITKQNLNASGNEEYDSQKSFGNILGAIVVITGGILILRLLFKK